MSVEAISLVLNHSRAEGTARLVLIGIANHDGDGGSWPAVATLARYANASESAVHRGIRKLVELGEIEVHRNDGGTHKTRNDRRPNRYVITLEPRGATSDTPSVSCGVPPAVPRGAAGKQDGVPPAAPEPSYEPSKEPSTPHSPPDADGSSAPPTAGTDELEAEFEGFWRTYPRQVAKPDARRAYRKARKSTAVDVIAHGLRLQLPDLQSRDLSKVPHPATWLNQRRWEDDPTHIAHQGGVPFRGGVERTEDGSHAGVIAASQW